MTPTGRKFRRTEEADTQEAIIDLCLRLGYLVFHDNDPQRNRAGFPDLVIVGYGKLVILELKTDRNEATPQQRAWLAELTAAGIDARIYRTSSWKTNDLVNELQTIRRNWTSTHPRTTACTTRTSPSRQRPTSKPDVPLGGHAGSVDSSNLGR